MKIKKKKKTNLNDDAHIFPCPYNCEAGKLRVWIVGEFNGAGQGFIGYFDKHSAARNAPSCR